jgi:hypothetical protein
LAEDLKDDVDRVSRKGKSVLQGRGGISRPFLQVPNLTAAPWDPVIAVWGMKCVGYDFKFEKHLARSLRMMKSLSSLSELANKCKAVTRNDNAMSEDEP